MAGETKNMLGSTDISPPKDPRQGWLVVGAAFIGLLMSFGTLVIYSFGVLSAAMASEFHWTGLQRGTLFASTSLAAAAGAPLWGAFADRRGGRVAALCSAGLLAAGLVVIASLPGDLMLMHFAFAALGLAGAGTMPPTFVNVIVSWFDRNRGLALGLSMISVGVGAAALPPISAALIAQLGWRSTYIVFGGSIGLVALPIGILFLRSYPDAVKPINISSKGRRASIRGAFALKRMWTLSLFSLVTGAVLVSTVSNFVPMLQFRGETIEQAARYQSILGLSLIAGRILIGSLIDRIFAPNVMLVVLLTASIGFFVLYTANTPTAYIVAAAGVGLAIGAEVDFLGFIVSRYFDRTNFTTIFAVLFALYALGGALTPPIIGWLMQVTGGYETGNLIFAILMGVTALSMLTLPSYTRVQKV